jgi:hypothetical protein
MGYRISLRSTTPHFPLQSLPFISFILRKLYREPVSGAEVAFDIFPQAQATHPMTA